MENLGQFDPILPYRDYSDEQPGELPPPHDAAAAPHQWRVSHLDSIIQGLPEESRGAGERSSKTSASSKGVAEPVFKRFDPGQLDCSRCPVLRELIHSNGYRCVSVTVHGGTNYFTHAIAEIIQLDEGGPISTTVEFYFADLGMQNGDRVAGFLNEYIVRLERDHWIVLKDTMHPLYTQLCGDSNQEAVPLHVHLDSWLQSPAPAPELDSMIQGLPAESRGAGERSSKTSASSKGVAEPVFIRFEPGQLDCSRCSLLGELIHSNGYRSVRVIVHGGTNYFTHAIFDIVQQDEGGPISTPVEFYFINLGMQNGEWVAGFLNGYIGLLDIVHSIVLLNTMHHLYTPLFGFPPLPNLDLTGSPSIPAHSGALEFNFDMDNLGRFDPEYDIRSCFDFSDEQPGEPVFIRFEPGQLDCSRCSLLGEPIHSIGYQSVKVTVHGGTNYFTHAIFEIERQDEGGAISTPVEFYFIKLEMQNGDWVAGFLKGCVVLLHIDHSIVLQNTMHPLCAQLCGDSNQEAVALNVLVDSWLQSPAPAPELGSEDEHIGSMFQSTDAPDAPGNRKAKTCLALQRERTQKITLKDLADNFHLSIADAAKNLGFCVTVIQRARGRYGFDRWPGREVKAINRQIDFWETELVECPSGPRTQELRTEIKRLKATKDRLYAGWTACRDPVLSARSALVMH